MAVRLITGLPGYEKSTWTNENCKDGIIIHTDDLYFTRHDERLPNAFHNAPWKYMCLSYTLNNIVDILAEDDELYYLEGYHLLLWCGFEKLIKYMYKLMVTEPVIYYENLVKKCKEDDRLVEFNLDDLNEKYSLIRNLSNILSSDYLLNPFYNLATTLNKENLKENIE